MFLPCFGYRCLPPCIEEVGCPWLAGAEGGELQAIKKQGLNSREVALNLVHLLTWGDVLILDTCPVLSS